ncbi:S41 family peptidase [Flavobacterium sp. XS1P32]
MKKIFLLLLILSCFNLNAQIKGNNKINGKWLVNLSLPDIGVVTTILEIESEANTYKAFSRKDADKLLLGKAKAPLMRGMSNFKNGSLIRVEKGEFTEEDDVVKLKGVLVSSMGNYNFIGEIIKDSINIALSKKNLKTIGNVIGSRKNVKLPLEDYSKLFAEAINKTRDKIYRKSLLEENEWKKFIENMNEIIPDIHDDLEMVSAFYYFGNKLKTSHFALLKSLSKDENNITKKNCVAFEEKSISTGYLKINSFDGSSSEMDSIFKIVISKNYKNLIVDLRDNSGGTVESGMTFANYVFAKPINGGLFLTQKWFNKNNKIPSLTQYDQFDFFSKSNYELIINGIHNKEGLYLKVIPNDINYKGNLFILTNTKTASTCEPLVYELKTQKRATIVGTKTAGAMLNAEKFSLLNNFYMYIPTADYYTSDGYRIEQNGVLPDIETKSEEALEKVINELIKN